MKKFLVLILSIIVFLLCVTPLIWADPITLKFWANPSDDTAKYVLTDISKIIESRHPGLKIELTFRSPDDLRTMQNVALKSNDGPDVCVINQSLMDMGLMANEGLIIPLDKYDAKYGWTKTFGKTLLKVQHYDKKTNSLGTGPMYCVSYASEFGLVAYNKNLFAKAGIKTVPATYGEFVNNMQLLKKNGIVPIIYGCGGTDGWTTIHLFYNTLCNYTDVKYVHSLIFGSREVHWNSPKIVKALADLQDWSKKGYFNDGFLGTNYGDSEKMFAAGMGAMFCSGNWCVGDIRGFDKETKLTWDIFLMPNKATFGTMGTGYGISAKSKYPDLAAEVLNEMMMDTKVHLKYNSLPVNAAAVNLNDPSLDPFAKRQLELWNQLVKNNGLGYYLDWATPTFYDTVTAALQDLLSTKITPQQCADRLEKDYKAHIDKKYKK